MYLRVILRLLVLVFSEGLILQGPNRPLVAQLGGVLQLPCSVETPLPLDELEVEWRRTSSKELVHLFQGGEIRPESQSSAYTNRAYLFTKGEIAKGNYSLLLRNITTDDAGSYSCGVYTNAENSEIAVEIEAIERLVLTGTDHAVTAYVGQEVVLNCFVDSHIPPEEVSWTKVDSDKSQMLVLLFQDNVTYPDSAHASYQGRTEFFNAEIPKGNFSLRLKDVRTEDKGEYMCQAYSGHLSANTTVVLQGLGLSYKHILVLTCCCSAIVVAVVASALIIFDIKESPKMRKGMVWDKYTAKEDGELDLVVGETIEILERNDWCLGKMNNKLGVFPRYYVLEIPPLQGKVIKGKVVCEYSAMKADELDLVVGETIEILQMDDKWSLGKHHNKVGLFPLRNIREFSALQVISERAVRMHYVLVFAPSIFMFTAFVLWGIIEGFLGEVVTCSTVNLIRFILLFKTCLYQRKLPGMIKTIINNGFMFEYFIIVSVLYFVIFFNVWSIERESKAMAFMGIMYGSSLHMGIRIFFANQRYSFFGGSDQMEIMDLFYLFTVSYLYRTFNESTFISMFAGIIVMIFSLKILIVIIRKKYMNLFLSEWFFLGMRIFILIRRLIISVVVFYFFNQILENHEERAGLLSVTALLHLLALTGISTFMSFSLAETPEMILYKYGAVGLVAVNATTLATELILKSHTGERTVADLRVVVLPFECVFVLGWMVLWSHAYWKVKGGRIKRELDQWIKSFKGVPKTSDNCEMTNMSSQPSTASSTQQLRLPEPPPETEADIHVPADVSEDTYACSSKPVKEDPLATDTAAEANTDTERHANASAAEEINTSPILVDKDVIPSTLLHKPVKKNTDSLLSNGEREPETNSEEPRRNSVTEHMESTPLLQGEVVKSDILQSPP